MPGRNDLLTKIDLFLDPTRKDVEPRAAGMIGHTRMFCDRKAINEAERTIDFVMSSGEIDRMGEIVEPRAFEPLDAFMRNPVMPFGHSYEAMGGVTPTVGHWRDVRVANNALIGKAWFKPRGLGEECFLDFLDGNLSSVSVAFMTRAYEMREMKIDGRTQRVRVFTDVELLECSVVVIPANPSARIRAAGFGNAGTADADLEARVDRAVAKALEKHLDPAPGGRLCDLLMDIAQATRSHGGDGFEDDGDVPDGLDDPPGGPAADEGGDDDFKRTLKEVLGK